MIITSLSMQTHIILKDSKVYNDWEKPYQKKSTDMIPVVLLYFKTQYLNTSQIWLNFWKLKIVFFLKVRHPRYV